MTPPVEERDMAEKDRNVRGKDTIFVPVTPGGSYLMHLESRTEEQAWKRLLRDAAHMPYQGVEGFKARGYSVSKLERVA